MAKVAGNMLGGGQGAGGRGEASENVGSLLGDPCNKDWNIG